MQSNTHFLNTIPVLSSLDIARDISWHQEKTGFRLNFSDGKYASISRENSVIHLQWHDYTADDPLLGGSVIKIFVKKYLPAL